MQTQVRSRPRPALTREQARCLNTLENQQRVTSWPYFSKVKFRAPRAGAAPSTYDIPAQTVVRAFSYGIGESMLAAGWPNANDLATFADTNLITRQQTNSGQNVHVYGIACQVLAGVGDLAAGDALPHRFRLSDGRLLAALWESVSVSIVFNGTEQQYRLGTLGMVPGAGGLNGGAFDNAGLIALAGEPRCVEFPANGMPARSNFFRVPEGLIWRDQGADSLLSVEFRVERAIRIPTGGSAENNVGNVAASNAPAAVATGTEGYAYPTELCVGLMVHLVGHVEGDRTTIS